MGLFFHPKTLVICRLVREGVEAHSQPITRSCATALQAARQSSGPSAQCAAGSSPSRAVPASASAAIASKPSRDSIILGPPAKAPGPAVGKERGRSECRARGQPRPCNSRAPAQGVHPLAPSAFLSCLVPHRLSPQVHTLPLYARWQVWLACASSPTGRKCAAALVGTCTSSRRCGNAREARRNAPLDRHARLRVSRRGAGATGRYCSAEVEAMQTRRPCRGRELHLVGCQARHAREGIVARFWLGWSLPSRKIDSPTAALQHHGPAAPPQGPVPGWAYPGAGMSAFRTGTAPPVAAFNRSQLTMSQCVFCRAPRPARLPPRCVAPMVRGCPRPILSLAPLLIAAHCDPNAAGHQRRELRGAGEGGQPVSRHGESTMRRAPPVPPLQQPLSSCRAAQLRRMLQQHWPGAQGGGWPHRQAPRKRPPQRGDAGRCGRSGCLSSSKGSACPFHLQDLWQIASTCSCTHPGPARAQCRGAAWARHARCSGAPCLLLVVQWPRVLNAPLEQVDPELYDIIEHEKNRQWKVWGGWRGSLGGGEEEGGGREPRVGGL